MQGPPARHGEESGGTRRPSGHVSGRVISGVTAVTGPPEDLERPAWRRAVKHHAGFSGPLQTCVSAAATVASGQASASSGGSLSSEDSYEAAPPRQRSQPINAELVKLVASFAPLELAQLKAMEQKARLKKTRALDAVVVAVGAAATAAEVPQDTEAARDVEASTEPRRELEKAGSSYAAAPPVEPPVEPARVLVRPSTADATRAPNPPMAAPTGRTRSQSATRPTHLPAAPAKGAIVKRDLNILPNPVAQKQTETIQRQAAVAAFVKRLQREQDLLRADKERRLKAEQEALAAQLNEEAKEARAAAAEVTRVSEVAPVRRKKTVPPSTGVNAALKDMQAAAEDVPEKKPIDPKPWRQNMRKQKNPPVAGEAPIGAPREVAAKAATGAPPPRNASPGAAAARAKTLDPVARTQLKEYMERKAKDMAAKQLQEKAAQQEAKTAQVKVIKAEMAKARERAQKYADATKENPTDFKGPRPAWVDILPAEGGAAAGPPSRAVPPQQAYHAAAVPDHDFVSERAMPYHMSDAMRMEAADRRRQERLFGSASPTHYSGGRPTLVDNFGHPLGDDNWGSGPQVVRVRDPEVPEQVGRAYRASSARPTRPSVNPAPTTAQAAVRQIQVGQPIAPEALRTIGLEARLAARKKYEQHQRELQAAERRDISRGRDTSRGRDNSRGRRRSPTTGRKHEATSLNSRSRSPAKRAKQQMRRSRSASRAGSANRRPPPAESQSAAAGTRDAGRLTAAGYPTAVQVELQQARNERHVDNLWDLALQLSARLGALQQQGVLAAPHQPMQAWPEPQAQLEQQQSASLRGSMAGPLLPYPPPVAVVPTGLPADYRPLRQDLADPRRIEQYDEAVEADIEFQTEASWPIPGHKKPRTTGSSSVGFGADSSMGYGAPSSAGAGARSSAGIRRGVPTSLFGGDSSVGGQSRGDAEGSTFASDEEAAAFYENGSVLANSLHPTSVVVGTTHMSSGSSQSSLSTHSRDQDAPSLHGKSDPASPAHRARNINEGGRGYRTASLPPGQASIPSSPSKQVPAAPIIQIPLPPATSSVTADSVAPSVAGLPYDNATFSAESADDDCSSSGGESTYGQRVLTIAELHDMLEENPQLSQRLSLDRERDRWEQAFEPAPSYRGRGVRSHPQLNPANVGGALASPSYGGTSEDSYGDSDPGTPTRPCEAIVNEYERANSPLRLRPAQRELLKAQAAKRDEERLEAMDPENSVSGGEDESGELDVLQLPKSGDPMSIISLVAHKGKLPERPTIIQLSEPPVLDGYSPTAGGQQTRPAEAQPGIDTAAQGLTARRTSEVLLVPGPKGPQLVFSRELLHLQQQPHQPPPQQQQPHQPSSLVTIPRKTTKETGVGEGRVDHGDPNGSSSQQLTNSMPPFVLVSAAATEMAPSEPLVQQSINRAVLHTSRAPTSPAAGSPAAAVASMQQQVDLMRSLHQQQLHERGLASPTHAAERRRSAPGAAPVAVAAGPDDGGSGLLGAMTSPPPRPRMVTFLDEVQGPPERVRLAPTELFNQMQNTLKTYEELDAADLELQQLQNARAIAAVQREAHRIAQRLDQTAAAEAQLQLIAQTQAEMDAKLHAFEATIRDEVRKDSLSHLHDVTSLFVEQLSRNKVVHTHSAAQTMPPQTLPPKPDFGVQDELPLTQHPVSILRSNSPHQQRQQSPSRSPSPPHLHQTSLRPMSPAQGTQTSPHQPSAGHHGRSQSRGGSPGPGGQTGLVSFQRPSSKASNPTTEYSENFEDSEMQQSSYISGRSASRVSFRQTSHLSVPKSVSEEVEEESEGDSESESDIKEEFGSRRASRDASLRTATATSIPESVMDYRERQLSRASDRQTSFTSVAESIPSERPAPRSALRQQSTASIVESSPAASTHGSRRHSGGGTESVPYTTTDGETQGYSSIQESLPARHSGRTPSALSGASRRRRSAIEEDIPSESSYSSEFEKDEEDRISEENFATPSRSGRRTTRDEDDDYSAGEVDGEPSGRRSSQRRRTATTVSARSAEVAEEIRNGGVSRSYSQDDDVQEDSGLVASNSSPHLQLRPGRPAEPGGSAALGARDAHHRADMAGVMTTPPSGRTVSRLGDSMLAGASPLTMRASIDGGLELDDDVMASYAADAEKRMRQEVALLQDRLQDINQRTAAKMSQLEAELAVEAQPQKRQVLMRAQRLLQVQHDADAADIQRQISAIKADFSRQRLMLEGLYRLAQLKSPGGALAAKRAGPAPADEGRRQQRAAKGAPVLEPGRTRRASSSRSIEEDMSSQHAPFRSGSVAEEGGAYRGRHSSASSIVEEPSGRVRGPSSSGNVGEDIRKGSVSTDVVEYSDQFEPSGIKQSRSQLFPSGNRPPRPSCQPSSIVDDIEESLSGRRLETSGAQSQSVVTEDNFKRSASSAANKSQRPTSGSVATESSYSEDFDASGGSRKGSPPRPRGPQRRGSSSARSDGLDSELSALSLKLEREKVELARQLQERRRAKILAKQVEVEQMRAKLAALEGKAPAHAARANPEPKPAPVSDDGSEGEIKDEVSGYSRPGMGSSASKAIISEMASKDDAQSVEESEVAEESEIGSGDGFPPSVQQSDLRSGDGVTASASADDRATSSTPSREPVDPDLATVEQDIARLKEQIQRARQAKLEAAQRQKQKLEAELKLLTSSQPVRPSGAPEPRRAAPAPAPSGSHGTSADSASYSQDFTASGSVSAPSARGAKSSSTVVDEVSQSTLQRIAGQVASDSRSKSVSEERIDYVAQTSRGVGSHSGSVLEDETKRAGLHSSRSSGGGAVAGAGRASNSGEVYDESFETDSVRDGSIPREISEIQDEPGSSQVPSSSDPTGATLEPIREEDARSVSGHSISYAADSVADRSVRESVVDLGSDTGFGGFQAPGGDTRSIEESGHAQYETTEGVQPTASRSVEDVIEQFSVGSGNSAASQSVEDEQGFSVEDPGAHATSSGTSGSVRVDVVPSSKSHSGSQERGKDSQDSQPVLSEEFFTTADINTPSVTPSIHSADIEAAKTSSVPTGATQSAVSQEATIPVAEFMTSADTFGESVTPSIRSIDLVDVQESSLQEVAAAGSLQDLEEEEEEPLIVTQQSSSSFGSSSSESVSEEQGGAGQPSSSRSAEVLEDSLPADEAKASGSQGMVEEDDGSVSDREVDYSETADIEFEESEEEASDSALRRDGAGIGQSMSVREEAVEEDEYSPDFSAHDVTSLDSIQDVAATEEDLEGTRVIESADVVDDATLQTASASAVSDGPAQRSTAAGSTGIVSDAPAQRSAATDSTTVSALPEESQVDVDDYDLDFQPSALEVPAEESSRRVFGATCASASESRLVSAGDVQEEELEEEEEEELKEEDYDLDFQPSALMVESSSRKSLQPPGVSATASRLVSATGEIVQEEGDDDEVEDYALDFQPSALEVPGEESLRRVLEPPAASASASLLASTGEMVQDASELLAQSSLRDVASASSLGSRRLPVTSQASAKALPSVLQQQASSASATTYEEDFDEAEPSELHLHGATGLGRTTLSVVEEEGEAKSLAETAGSKLYSEDFAAASVLKSHEEPEPAAQQSLPAVRSATGSAASEVQDVEYDYEDMGVDDDEDEQQFSAGSTGLVGPVLPPAATTSVALEVSQRYGPASEQSSSRYSDDFSEQPGHDTFASAIKESASVAVADPTSSFTVARDADKGLQPLVVEPRAGSSLHKLASQSAERRVSTPTAVAAPQESPPPVAAEPSASRQPPVQGAEDSVFSVEEEDHTSATVSSEPSAQELSRGPAEADPKVEPQDAKGAAGTAAVIPQALDLDADDDDYTRDFTDLHSNVEAQSSSNAVAQEPEKDTALVSHPISQPPSPPTRSEGGASSRESESEEVPDEDLQEEDLDLSDLGFDTPLAAVLAEKNAAAGAAPSEPGPDSQPAASAASALMQTGAAEEGSTSMASEVEGEESGIIAVPRGMGIRQTRKIESRTWRNQQALLEEDEGGLSGDVDLVDMSMPGGEGSGLLDMLGADLITEASEANTPSHSFRIRSGDLTSAPSSASPFGGRSTLSARLATLRESLDHEGEEAAANSEAVSPSAARALQMWGEGLAGSERSRQAEEAPSRDEAAEETAEIADEVIPSQLSGSGSSFLPAARAEQPPEPAPQRSDAGAAAPAEPLPEPFGAAEAAAATGAAREQPGREASGGSGTQYSEDLEAPPSEASAGRQSVIEYDMYTSAALLEDDSDDLKQMAAAFESQAIGLDDEEDDGGVAHDHSGISASGLSDDLSKYQVAVQPDSDEEPGDASRAVPDAAVAVLAAAAPPPAPQEADEEVPSAEEEASEVADEELEAAVSDPFSVDESADRLPTLQPAAAAQPPPRLLTTAAQATAPAAGQPADDAKSEVTARADPAAEAAEPSRPVPVPDCVPVCVPSPSPSPSPTASSPKSERSSRGALPDETSMGPLPRSGLGGDDEDDDQGLEYRALYKPHGEDSSKPGSPKRADTEALASPQPGEEAKAVAAAEDGSGGKGGYLQALREFVASDDDGDDVSSGPGGRGLSAASLKPAFQALLDEPEAEGDFPKGDFESEIEEMLALSRSRSRLVSPYQSKDFAPDPDPDGNTTSNSTHVSQAGILPAAVSTTAPPAATAPASDASPVREPTVQETQEKPAPTADPACENVVDEITESTVKELVADAVEVMVGATGQGGSPFQTASAPTASAAQPRLPALSSQDEDEGIDGMGQAAEDSRVSMGGEASISISVDDLEGDIELDADPGLDSGAAVDLPSPILSDSGSLGSPMHTSGPGAPQGSSGAAPALGPERSGRDLALSGSGADDTLGDSGISLNSDEDPGWGGTEEEDWQQDVSGLIAPEMDRLAIERDSAPAVATGAAAVEEYASQVLEQFMDNRPEFLVPGAEPLSLEGFLDQERRLVNASEAQHIHNKMVYDAINEALLVIYRAANRIESQPWLRRNRIVKPLPSPADMAQQVQQQLRAWAAMRMRDPAETDKVLAMDTQEDERARGDLTVEEAEVQREVADLIWADIIEDTARQLADLEQLLAPASSARSSMAAGGRRRLDAIAV